jgi:hypothetical protein
MSTVWYCTFATSLGLAAIAALGCSDAETRFGSPGGLAGKQLPAPVLQGDGGAPPPPVDSGPPPEGGPPVDAGPCLKSWKTDIFPNMLAAGHWQCGATGACHGGAQAPSITADATVTYNNLAAYTMKFAPADAGLGLPFILPGSTDSTKSAIDCNLSGSACGTEMPLVTAGALTLSGLEVQTLGTWVQCGSPNN